MQPECLWPLKAELGEGPVWCPREQVLWFTDIKQRRLHRFDPATGAGRSFVAPDQPGFALPARGGGLIVGMPGGLHHFDPQENAYRRIVEIEADRPGNRLNDACVDSRGRLWFGSMDDAEVRSSGALYRWDGAGPPSRHDDHIVITNGPALSPDGRTLYHTDTLQRLIHAFDLDDDGRLHRKRTLIRIEADAGHPDGSVVDAQGCLWVALWGGWGVRRYSPQGELLDFLRFPCANVTKIAFGGSDLRTVYATSARKGLSPAQRLVQPQAGALFFFRSDTPGQPATAAAWG
jgi:sugar lactone lactonase YvrE